MKYIFLSALAIISVMLLSGKVLADPVACDSCAGYPENAFMRSGGVDNVGPVGFLICRDGVWIDRNPKSTQNELRDGLVARWKFDESSGVTAADSSGNNLNGTLVNGPVWLPTDGRLQGALRFDGVDDVVNVNDPGTNSILDFPSGSSITITAWVKRNAVGSDWQAIVYKGANNDVKYGFALSNDRLAFAFHASGFRQMESTATVSLGAWNFVAASYTFGTGPGALYLNGENAGLTLLGDPYTGNPGVSNAPLQMGSNSHNERLTGELDDVRIYNRVLSPSEIAYLYRFTGPTGSCP